MPHHFLGALGGLHNVVDIGHLMQLRTLNSQDTSQNGESADDPCQANSRASTWCCSPFAVKTLWKAL